MHFTHFGLTPATSLNALCSTGRVGVYANERKPDVMQRPNASITRKPDDERDDDGARPATSKVIRR